MHAQTRKIPLMKAPTIDEFIVARAAALTVDDIAQLSRLVAGCREKAGRIPTEHYPRLPHQIAVLVAMLRQCPQPRPAILPESAWRELIVGASYLTKGVDCIPDQVPELGYADDAGLIDKIFERNRPAILRASRDLGIPAHPECLFL